MVPSTLTDDALRDDLDEVDFLVSQELFREARELLEKLAKAHPESTEVLERLRRIEPLAEADQVVDLAALLPLCGDAAKRSK